MMISIIIPTLNESNNIVSLLASLQPYQQAGYEIIIVDGGSTDDTVKLAKLQVDQVLTSSLGRAKQMNAGAKAATGQWLWFLHADTILPKKDTLLLDKQLLQNQKHWGRFNVRLSGHQWQFRVIEWFMNQRSCLTGICTGDQGIFIKNQLFKDCHGFPEIAIMEDIAMSKQLLKQVGRPFCHQHQLITSSRRWEKNGIWKTVYLMWQLRWAYFWGCDPEQLKQRYQ